MGKLVVKDLIKFLSEFDSDKEVIFYNINNYDLESRELETILDMDNHVEITVRDIR